MGKNKIKPALACLLMLILSCSRSEQSIPVQDKSAGIAPRYCVYKEQAYVLRNEGIFLEEKLVYPLKTAVQDFRFSSSSSRLFLLCQSSLEVVDPSIWSLLFSTPVAGKNGRLRVSSQGLAILERDQPDRVKFFETRNDSLNLTWERNISNGIDIAIDSSQLAILTADSVLLHPENSSLTVGRAYSGGQGLAISGKDLYILKNNDIHHFIVENEFIKENGVLQ